MLYHLFSFFIYICILLIIAAFTKNKAHGKAEFFLGGRSLSALVTALSAGASDMSSWLLMVLPGLVYVHGLNQIWMPGSILLGAYANWRLIAKPLRIYTEEAGNALTITSYLRNRFTTSSAEKAAINIVSGGAILIFFTLYAAAGFIAGAEILALLFNLDQLTALVTIATIIIFYTSLGGFLAISYVDLLQGLLMLVALLIVPVMTGIYLSHGGHPVDLLSHISSQLEGSFDLSPLAVLSLLAWGLGYFGQPHIQTKFMAIRNPEGLQFARRICISWMFLSLIGAISTGLFGALYFQASPLKVPNTVFITLSNALFHPFISGILITAIMAAVMSTVSAQLLMCASIITEDFFHTQTSLASQKKQLFFSRVAFTSISLVAVFIALAPNQTLFQVVGFAWSGLGAAFGPVILASLYARNMTAQSALLGITVGTLSILIWKFLASLGLLQLIGLQNVLPGFELLPAFILSFLSIFIMNTLKPQQNSTILLNHEKSRKRISAC